ncbi:unannotated protein [freshwater metagenome]|uniref:Unannotated protein n=1 Tax=freshwater metagenome TaxID=449393 RepID=A0A6J7D5R4_9ZZZZ
MEHKFGIHMLVEASLAEFDHAENIVIAVTQDEVTEGPVGNLIEGGIG